MAWMSSGTTNQQLVDRLYSNGVFKDDRIYKALLEIDRGNFVRENQKGVAYQDCPLVIYDQGTTVTISAPHMHAMQLDLLSDKLVPGANCLDIGSGSGYIVAAMTALLFPEKGNEPKNLKNKEKMDMNGKVIGLEYIKDLVPWSIQNCLKVPRFKELNVFETKRIEIKQGNAWECDFSDFPDVWEEDTTSTQPDPTQLSLPAIKTSKKKFRGFDAIHVGAAAEDFPPNLMKALKIGGKMVIPVGGRTGPSFFGFSYSAQTLYLVTRTQINEWEKQEICDVQFVPLVKK